MAQEQHGRFGERPLQMDVAHLRAAGAELLAAGLLHALDQPRVRGELLHAIEARDVVDLVEDRQREDLADARHRAQPVERVGIVALRLADDRQLEVDDERVVLVDQRQVDLDALPHTRIGEVLDARPSRLAG